MHLRYRIIGGFIVACGLAVCYGALALWPEGLLASPWTWGDVARIAGAVVAAVFGVGNVFAGTVVVLRPPVQP